MVVDDRELHLRANTSIVNSMTHYDFNGGLGEAAAWLCLREDICVSLVKQCPLRSGLDKFLQSDVFRRRDDAAYASRMIFILAKLLSCVFSDLAQEIPRHLKDIEDEVDSWFRHKPPGFDPIRDLSPSCADGRPLPEIWMLLPFQGTYLPDLLHFHVYQ